MRAPDADDLAAAARECIAGIERQPASALAALVERVAAGILPRLRARSPGGAADIRLSELVSTLSIVAGDTGLVRGRTSSLRTARRHLERLLELVPVVAEAERAAGESVTDAAAEDRARSQVMFVAPPERPATEAYVLRSNPRPLRVWSPPRPALQPGSGGAAEPSLPADGCPHTLVP